MTVISSTAYNIFCRFIKNIERYAKEFEDFSCTTIYFLVEIGNIKVEIKKHVFADLNKCIRQIKEEHLNLNAQVVIVKV